MHADIWVVPLRDELAVVYGLVARRPDSTASALDRLQADRGGIRAVDPANLVTIEPGRGVKSTGPQRNVNGLRSMAWRSSKCPTAKSSISAEAVAAQGLSWSGTLERSFMSIEEGLRAGG